MLGPTESFNNNGVYPPPVASGELKMPTPESKGKEVFDHILELAKSYEQKSTEAEKYFNANWQKRHEVGQRLIKTGTESIKQFPPILVPSVMAGLIEKALTGQIKEELPEPEIEKEEDFSSNFIKGKLAYLTNGEIILDLEDRSVRVRKNPETGALEGSFLADFNHDGKLDVFVGKDNIAKLQSVLADLKTGFGTQELDGKKIIFHVDKASNKMMAHVGQIIEVDSKPVELYKDETNTWHTSDEKISPNDFVFDDHPPYGLKKEDLPADADMEIFGVTYEYEKQQ